MAGGLPSQQINSGGLWRNTPSMQKQAGSVSNTVDLLPQWPSSKENQESHLQGGCLGNLASLLICQVTSNRPSPS